MNIKDNKVKFPEVITLQITSRCNNNCIHCFGPKDIEEMNFTKLKKLFSLFAEKGVKAVLLGGGEPLIRKDFDKIIMELKKYNFQVFLDTNGDLFKQHQDLISKNIGVLGLPIDFPNSSYRNKGNLKSVLAILSYYKKEESRPLIRIGTVVTKDNFKKLNEVGELIKNLPVDIWKIYQFTPQNRNALNNRRALEISQSDFEAAAQQAKEQFSKYFDVIISSRINRNRAYFFVAPDGMVTIPSDNGTVCKQMQIGNIFDKDIIQKWNRFASDKRYKDNAKVTFKYNF